MDREKAYHEVKIRYGERGVYILKLVEKIRKNLSIRKDFFRIVPWMSDRLYLVKRVNSLTGEEICFLHCYVGYSTNRKGAIIHYFKRLRDTLEEVVPDYHRKPKPQGYARPTWELKVARVSSVLDEGDNVSYDDLALEIAIPDGVMYEVITAILAVIKEEEKVFKESVRYFG